MTLRKIVASVAFIFLLASLGLIGHRSAKAAEIPQEVTFVLHKRVFLNPNSILDSQINSGLELTPENVTEENDALIDDTQTFGINGINFDVYDASAYLAGELAQKTMEEVMQAILETDSDTLRETLTAENLVTTITTTQDPQTGENGMVTLTLDLSEVAEQNPAILFLEKLPNNSVIRQEAAPMLVVLPVEDPMNEGQFLDTIHLYPKNVLRGRLPQTGGEEKPKPSPTPTPGGRLPQTGEAKSIMGIVGILIVGSVIIYWQRRRTSKQVIRTKK